jgi:MSHA biogenesis protein MshQ
MSSDNFSVRPTAFTLSSFSNADATGLSTTATPIVKAGANFSLTAASGKVGYNFAPVIDSTKLSSHSGAVQNGIISGSFSSANAATGTATGSSFSYSEVGYFRFLANGVYDDSFTAVDSANSDCTNDFSNTLVGGKYGCKFGNTATTNYFGRFIPDHFSLSQGSTTEGCGSVFTYFGQDGFTTTFTLTAQNGSNVKTSNYIGSFAKLGLTNWNNFVFTASSLPSGSALSASSTAPTGSWSNGAALVSAMHQVSRPSTLTGATSVSVSAAPVDVDGVTMASAPVAPAATLRYGRINLSNAHGSELLTMPVSMTAEYYSGASFITNSDDNCSVTTVSISDPLVSDSLVPADSCIWDDNSLSGSFKCSTTAPSSTTYREAASLVSGNFNLNLKAPQKTGPLDISASVANWLQFDWHGTGLENPSSKATFGIFKGNQKFIYLREVY